jgi:hypothetical protein
MSVGSDINIATNSFKAVKLMGGQGQGWMFGTMPDLINAAVTGKFVSTRRQKRRWFYEVRTSCAQVNSI